jgi:hypothetical protein
VLLQSDILIGEEVGGAKRLLKRQLIGQWFCGHVISMAFDSARTNSGMCGCEYDLRL